MNRLGYYLEHRDHMRESQRRWYSSHREQRLQSVRKWKSEHPEQVRVQNVEYLRVYRRTVEGKISKAKSRARRQRQLSSELILGLPQKGFVGHHLTPELVVFIPEVLHVSIRHSLDDSESMKRINQETLRWISNPDDLEFIREFVGYQGLLQEGSLATGSGS